MDPGPTADRFAFGKNWQSFAAIADDESISEAQQGLIKLFPNGDIRGARILDVGCGSGLSMAAALRLGASQVDGVDIDPNSIKAASELLSKFDVGKNWSVHAASLFDLPARTYDIVYSWGVLHHTGAMWRALEHVTTFVRPGGLLAVAIIIGVVARAEWRHTDHRRALGRACMEGGLCSARNHVRCDHRQRDWSCMGHHHDE